MIDRIIIIILINFPPLSKDKPWIWIIAKNISEHKMSLDLDKSGSYIRGITSGAALPSLRELFNIISYFDMTPAEFFAPLDDANCEDCTEGENRENE